MDTDAMKRSSTDVLIVGAGPTGLMMSTLLARLNVRFRIVEKNDGPARESRAVGIQARTLELFQNIGIIDEFLKRGYKPEGAQVFLNGRKRFGMDLTDMARPDSPSSFLFLLPQSDTEQILLEDLRRQGAQLERGIELETFAQDRDRVVATLRHKDGTRERVDARYIMGCDGSHSRVREVLGLKFEGDSYQHEFIMADARVENVGESSVDLRRLSIFLDNGGIAALFPLRGETLSRVLAIRRSKPTAQTQRTTATTNLPTTLPEVERAFNEVSRQTVRLTEPRWLAKYHVHHRAVEKTRVGRAFLAGDASHIHSPVGGQGMNTGLQDAANLAWKLAAVLAGEADERWLDTYHSERWPIGQKLLRFTDRIFSAAVTRNRWAIALRNLLLPAVTKAVMAFPEGKRRLFGFISELNVHYHGSIAAREELSSAVTDAFRRTLPAGFRAPDARLRQDLDVFDLIGGYRFHLLVFNRGPISDRERQACATRWRSSPAFPKFEILEHWISLAPSGEGVISAENDEVFQRYGVETAGVFLVRPDGYIGYRSDDWELAFGGRKAEAKAPLGASAESLS